MRSCESCYREIREREKPRKYVSLFSLWRKKREIEYFTTNVTMMANNQRAIFVYDCSFLMRPRFHATVQGREYALFLIA